MKNSPLNPLSTTTQSAPWGWLCTITLVSMALRAACHFRTPLVPGMDAAYYLIQSRSLLERGVLQNADLPLTFWLQASLAWTLQRLAGLSLNDSIMLAVKLSDSLLPALTALPMGWLGWRWSRTKSEAVTRGGWPAFSQHLPALLPAALVSLSWPMMRMVGDFQKNALGLLWFAVLISSSQAFMQRPGWRTACIPLMALTLVGMTHIGVLGAAIVFVFMLLLCGAFTLERKVILRLSLLTFLAAVVLGSAIVLVTRATQTTKFERLLNALTDPLSYNHFLGGDQGPLFFRVLVALPWMALAGAMAVKVWRRKEQGCAADRALAFATAATAALLVLLDQQGRLMLIAVIPTAAALSFLLASLRPSRRLAWIGTGMLVVVSLSGVFVLGTRPVIDEAQFAELEQLVPLAQPTEECIVLTQHGVEFWAGWVLHTNAKQIALVQPQFWEDYPNVLYLKLKEVRRGPPPGRERRPGKPLTRPARPTRPASPSEDWQEDQRNATGPHEHRDPRRNVEIPTDATILHEGANFVLARVPAQI